MKKFIGLLLVISIYTSSYGQKVTPTLQRVEPLSWWIGMKDPNVQLMVYGQNISSTTVTIDYPGVEVMKIHPAENKNFLFIDLMIKEDAQPGSVMINFNYGKKKKLTYDFRLNEREKNRQARVIDQNDIIYLVTPDRFANGDTNNDEVAGLKEGKNRAFAGGRHGGDLQGVISKINYMEDLGITALWLNPVIENDMKEYSYHGYAITDYYKVDPRYGTNELYKKLADELHAKDMKIIMDMVFNHCGLEHWWMKDMPFPDWVHDYPDYKITNYSISSLSDPHAAGADQKQMERGWFVPQMPDLNHDNAFLATYLIQNSIWWIEYAGLDGIRMDTYPYNKKEFMSRWAQKIHEEYPTFYLVGETWVENESLEARWSYRGPDYKGDFNTNMNSMTDFPLCFSIHKAFKKEGNVMDLYRVLSQDFLYYDAGLNKTFADNHDMDRIFAVLGEDLDKFKLATTFLFTTRGIPQLYYGTEILMKGHGEHGIIREDFPGGWTGDSRNAFTESGRTDAENEAFKHIQKLLKWRKSSDVFKNGHLTHFIPFDNLYVYNQKSPDESVVVLINNNSKSLKPDMTRYEEILKGYDSATDLLSNKKITDLNEIEIEANSSMVLILNPLLKAEK
ncbi:MAG TPA: glycoside hydrolase family 13 protein [Cyclobacteriaceae bacterium]|nr:glycoside hydrolase family 13 protein [Cyclobacteriaceae bacterium]